MNTFFFRSTAVAFAFLAICLISSCVEDDPLPIPGDNKPSITILDTTLTSPSLSDNSITLTAFAGDSPLESVTIKKNGSVDFLDVVSIDGSEITNHQIDLSGTDKTSFSYRMSFHVLRGEPAVFTFTIIAENGDSASQTKTIYITPDLRLPSGTDAQLCPVASLKSLKFTGLIGSKPLYSVGVFENSIPLHISRLTFGDTPATSNPILLKDDQLSGFTENLIFRTHTATDSSVTYRFVLTDIDSLENTISILIKTSP